MNKDAALKLALAFIERVNMEGWVLADFEQEMYAAIAAIKEALGWQGLTDEEINAGMDRAVLPVEMQQAFGAGARWAEAKLKEKNT